MEEELKNEVLTEETVTEPKKKNKKKKAIIIIAAVLVFILVSNTIATKIIYDNIFKRYDKAVYDNLITDAWQEMMDGRQEFTVDGKQGKIQTCLYTASVTGEDGTPVLGAKEKGLVVIAPGLHAGMDNYIGLASYLVAMGYDVVSFDPTGTRESEGKSCIGYSQEVYDLDAVLDYAEELKDYETVYVVGHSRGATAACALLDSANKDISDHEITGVISVSGFNSAMDAVIGLSSSYIGPVANINYPTLWAYQLTLFDYNTLQIQADQILNQTDAAVLILQGAKDDTARVDKYSIYNKKDIITSANKTFYLSETCGHTDLLHDESGNWNADTLQVITEWLGEN